MKRVISFIVAALLAVNVVFAKGFFSNRIFELRADVPVNVSNNVFSMNDIMVKDLVIDLPKIADSVPKSGFNTIIETTPSVSTNLNIFGLSIGANVGANAFVKLNIDKGLFDFLGSGYKAGDNLTIAVNPVADVFAFAEVPVGFKIRRFKISVIPSLFIPIASVDDCNVGVTAYNLPDGTVGAKLNADINFYASGLYDVATGAVSFDSVPYTDYLGFDIGGSMEMPFLMEDLTLRVDARVPILPGKLTKKGNMTYKYDFEKKISELITPPAEDGTSESGTGSTTPAPDPAPTPDPVPADPSKPEGESPAPDFTPEITDLAEPYVINRPLKIAAYGIYNPVKLLTLVGGGGVGIRRPFTDSYYVYPEYYFSATVSLLDILKASVSTEYTDEIFKHELTGIVNLRFFELDLGVSLESGNFAQSFNMAGLGAKVGVVLGF